MSRRTAINSRSGKHILVVEDDPAIGEMLMTLLELEGYVASLAPTAAEAMNVISKHARSAESSSSPQPPPDLIVLDLQLPAMNGEQMMKQLADTGYRLPPVIIVSARREAALDAAAQLIGAAAVVSKPFAIDDLLARIDAALVA